MPTLTLEPILASVERPARYLGGEVNSVRKDLADVDVRFCLAFPDLYDLGLANVGLLILYSLLNKQHGVWCERTYAPAMDLEARMRDRELPLWSWESKTPLIKFDCLGFTLQYEMCYTTVLNMLDLAGIPLRSVDRDERHPIIIAGGPCVFNPEPLADFIDAFVIGDGEEVIVEIVEVMRGTKDRPRDERLRALAQVEGVYVPMMFETATLTDGTIIVLSDGLLKQNVVGDLMQWPTDPARLRSRLGLDPPLGPHPSSLIPHPLAAAIRKRLVLDLNATPYVTDYIVPWVQQVHDRVSLEIFRGCMRGCRFCQAGMITRPVRERSLETIANIVDETRRKTGYEELTLMSLSSCDYSQAFSLVKQTVEQLAPHNVSVSMPSTRVDGFNMEVAEVIAGYKKSNWTFAPEGGTQRMRDAISKPITEDELLTKTEQVFAGGWGHVKLYFMIGLPTETDEDVVGIAKLANEVQRRGRKANPRAKVNLGVSTHVPKPHTPFQWAQQIGVKETIRRQHLVRDALRDKKAVKFGHHDAETSFLEGVFSRGDRRLGRALEEAHKLGCKFDGWTEHLKLDAWREAFERAGIDAAKYLDEIPVARPLPWDHIDCFVTKEFHKREWAQTQANAPIEDCRLDAHCYLCGPINEFPKGKANPCVHMIHSTQAGMKRDAVKLEEYRDTRDGATGRRGDGENGGNEAVSPTRPVAHSPSRPSAVAVQRLRFRFTKLKAMRWLSHLELQSVMERALRRAELPMAFSQGFSPRPKLAFATALPVGLASEAEWADVELRERLEVADFIQRVAEQLPEGLELIEASEVALSLLSLASQQEAAVYTIAKCEMRNANIKLKDRVAELLAADELWVERKTKNGPKRINVRPLLLSIEVVSHSATQPASHRLFVTLADGSAGKGRPGEVTALLFGDGADTEIVKVEARFAN